MKKILLKGILFCAAILFICTYLLKLSAQEPTRARIAKWTKSTDYSADSGMLPFFDRARLQDGTTLLVMGDSVCRQMFNGLEEFNPNTSILATNAALMITGQYVLAEEYLQSHPDATDIFLVMHPLTMIRTFDMEWSYRYSVMTCVETDTLQYLDEDTIDVLKGVYGGFFLNKKVVQMIEASPVCRKLALTYLNSNRDSYVQSSSFEIADKYVKKLYDLCQEKNVDLHLYASPSTEAYREQIEGLAEEYQLTWMYSQYPDYINDILFYPSEWSEDLSHFSGEYAERDCLNQIMEQAFKDSTLLKKIKRKQEK